MLTVIGAGVVSCVVAVAGLLEVFNPFGGRPDNLISVVIDTPYVGPGVAKGTAVVMHGVKVGEVTAISSFPRGGVRINTDLQKTPIAGLTNAMAIDFRPINYFGVTGINLIMGTGGQPLRDGMQIEIVPKGNFALQVLLSRLGNLATGKLTRQLIEVVDKATRYTDALNPLIETALISANAVAETQTVSTARLLTNVTGLSVAFPPFVKAAIDVGDNSVHGNNISNWGTWNIDDATYNRVFVPYMDEASNGLFGAVGRLEATHVDDLLPVIDSVKALTDVVPPLIRPEGITQMLVELRSRLEKMYAGTPEQRAMQVRIVLDSLPGVAAPLAAMGGN
ncbi:hypothetical protein MMAN_21960 [Mycobacterium mantenii]|nr:Mammalian cell entry related domain protein [Mycobacterium mantenii]BBY38062.1 hypothetical protein MMAN_21960 [Mycobacterium mantenii]